MKTRSSDIRSALIDSGKTEFLEHGFRKASLRKICANAHVTTGAFYSQFEKKEDLFAAIVQPVLAEFNGIVQSFLKTSIIEFDPNSESQIAFLRCLFAHKDVFKLLSDCSDGTDYEGFFDHLLNHFLMPEFQNGVNYHAGTTVPAAFVNSVVSFMFSQCMELANSGCSFDEYVRIVGFYSRFVSAGISSFFHYAANEPSKK